MLFNDKRLQYAESEQLASWRTNRPGEQLIKIDVPLSRNLMDCNSNASCLNAIEFLWDPSHVVSCFIQVPYEIVLYCSSTQILHVHQLLLDEPAVQEYSQHEPRCLC